MQKLLRSHDVLGSTPQMTYKKAGKFGTSIGGCCSLLAIAVIRFYVSIRFIGFFTSQSFSNQSQEKYQPLGNPQLYSVSAAEVIPIATI